LAETLPKLNADNAQQEFYLTDIIALGVDAGRQTGMMMGGHHSEILGVNTVKELGIAADLMAAQGRIIS
jgi:bifunctional UDP-N-acetylglucosamine pyrophosphorylase/glucosamine-1-phosphate N-acetyltransferase/UDP-N-acetylglucosamine pyrophosphorylase